MTIEEFKNRMAPYARKLYPMMKRILGDEEETRDALQELMIKYWNKRHLLISCQNPDAYMATMARNFCFDLKKKHKMMLIDSFDETKVTIPATEGEIEIREKFGHIYRIMQNLPGKYREVLQLREIDGFTYEEIHELTGLEMPYIRVLLSRSRTRVREEIEKIYNYECRTYQPAG